MVCGQTKGNSHLLFVHCVNCNDTVISLNKVTVEERAEVIAELSNAAMNTAKHGRRKIVIA